MLLVAGVAWLRFTAPPPGNLTGSSLGGPLALIDQDGKRLGPDAFDGKYRLIYFGYTFCPDVCPTDVQVIGQGLKAFEASDAGRAAKVVPIFVTVDPERDDAKAVKAFVRAFHPRMVGLTGTPAEIDAVKKAYGIYARKATTSDPANYLVDHFAVVYLFGPRGAPIAFLPHQGLTAADVTRLLDAQVR
ncbi:electron transporter [alpha proteobacterium AAP81b]|nr:electron transporter [alpha proteobacterium AAP81b]